MKKILIAASSTLAVEAVSMYNPLKSEVSIYNNVNYPK